MGLPPEASAVHGIYDADVAEMPRFEQLAAELLERLAGVDLSGFNVLRFDLPLLDREFRELVRAGARLRLGGEIPERPNVRSR